ncbi:MAG: DUF2203 domain-containing protein [Acidobacteria bacterium]|nr:DUF2203 domain-containing protein [Acidobacteriota bacterium]
MRTFTLQEAQTLLPLVESLLKRAQEAARHAAALEAEQAQVAQRIYLLGGMQIDVSAVAKQKADHEKAVSAARDSLAEIDAIGVQIKDLNKGLLDFPFELDGKIVLLCWLQGEPTITHWHSLEAGFAGREPIDERFHEKGRPQ